MIPSSDRFSKVRAITEVAANLALVVAIVLGITVWLRRPNSASLFPTPSAVSNGTAIGKIIHLPGVDWSAHKATLVIAISSACHFCVNSTPFYSQLTHRDHAAPIVVVMPQEKEEAQAFLRQYAITPNSTVTSDLANIEVEATPTLFLISSSGTVTKSWVGELTETQQKQVFDSLDHT